MFDMFESKYNFGTKCDVRKVQESSMFRVFEVRYFGVRSKTSIKLGRQRGFYSWTKIGAQRPATSSVLTIFCIVSEVFVLTVSFPRNPVKMN